MIRLFMTMFHPLDLPPAGESTATHLQWRGIKGIIFFLLLIVGAVSCKAPKVAEQQIPKPDGRYYSEYPGKNLSGELNYISKTVKKLDCIAFYRSYIFLPGNTVDLHQVNDSVLESVSVGSRVTNQSLSGTATVIYYANSLVGMLTCAHVVAFPDTVVIRYDNGKGPVEVLSVKLRQNNYVKGLPSGENAEVVAIDRDRDLALLKKRLDDNVEGVPVLNYPVGIASSAAAQTISYVKPDNEAVEYINPEKVYPGKLFVDRKTMIKYGVTYNVSIEAVMDFLSENRDQIIANGFFPDYFFK